jgi:hypothetical protein
LLILCACGLRLTPQVSIWGRIDTSEGHLSTFDGQLAIDRRSVSTGQRAGAFEWQFLRVSGPEWLQRIGEFRSKVWSDEGCRMPEYDILGSDVWLDDLDKVAVHWVALHGNRLVAACRMSIHEQITGMPDENYFSQFGPFDEPFASFNRLVVSREYRGHGIARHFDLIRCRHAAEIGIRTVFAVPIGDRRRESLFELGFTQLFEFPVGHGLLLPERPMYGMKVDPASVGAVSRFTKL